MTNIIIIMSIPITIILILILIILLLIRKINGLYERLIENISRSQFNAGRNYEPKKETVSKYLNK